MTEPPHAGACRPVAPRLRTGSARLLLAAVAVAWGANWPVMKAGLEHLPPLWFAALRFVTGGLCLAIVGWAAGELRVPHRRDWPLVVSAGLLPMAAFTALVTAALVQMPAGRAAFIAYSTPLWVVLLAAVILGERPGAPRLAGMALGLTGACLLAEPGTGGWIAYGMLLLAALSWAANIVHVRAHRFLGSSLLLAPWQALVACLTLIPLAAAVEGPPPVPGSVATWAALAYVGPLATGFGFWGLVAAGGALPATAVSGAMLAAPLLGAALSVALLSEWPTPRLASGGVLVAAGVVLSSSRPRRKAPVALEHGLTRVSG